MRNALGLILACVMLALSSVIHSQDAPLSVSRKVTAETVETYYLDSVRAGQMIGGTLTGQGTYGRVEFFDTGGARLRQYRFRDGSIPVGVVSPAAGRLRVTVTASAPASAGSYTLTLRPRELSQRLKGRHVHPRVDHQSGFITRLTSELASGTAGAEDRFWMDVGRTGTPLIEPADAHHLLLTFVWKETYETDNVLLVWPPAFSRADDYYLSRLPATRVWYKTIRVRRGSRFTYAFSVNDAPDDRDLTTERDRFNVLRAYADEEDNYSRVELPGAPDERWNTMTPPRRGAVSEGTFDSSVLKQKREMWVYTPPDYASGKGPHPLIILFNGRQYVGSGVGPTVLDNLAGEQKIRPPVVCFIQPDPLPQLLTSRFAEAVASELVPRLRSTYRISPAASDVSIGGFSAAAVWAAYIALKHSNVFGNVFSQSGAFRGRLPGALEPNALAAMYAESPRVPVRFYIDSGLYEPSPANLPADEIALDESNTAGNRHFRDVLRAKGYDVTYRETGGGHEQLHWRATLAEALITLLPPSQP